ncbi:hypothetical protein SAMN04488700_1807 [Carnobacterium iners]|uniref:Uncharacterized protein n=1 Tax=Carnobacterium iners TaxID=1073423 RepID=A0A1X7NE72_9LACT|nr:hypothetical protein SAMN04488700_1807 [Carnobacterium iners]
MDFIFQLVKEPAKQIICWLQVSRIICLKAFIQEKEAVRSFYSNSNSTNISSKFSIDSVFSIYSTHDL